MSLQLGADIVGILLVAGAPREQVEQCARWVELVLEVESVPGKGSMFTVCLLIDRAGKNT